MRLLHLVSTAFAASCVVVAPRIVHACGGCFSPPPPPDIPDAVPPVVNAHRMALSISTEQTVLWDQIRYSGTPSEFAWVLPIKPGARVELASDAFFDVLDAATGPIVVKGLYEGCEGDYGYDGSYGFCSIGAGVGSFGCSAGDEAGGGGGDYGSIDPNSPDGVDVVSHGSAGPYETLVLSSEDPDALTNWLRERDYNIPEDIEPVISAYVEEGFDFVVLRLVPGAGVQQMRPVRVIMEGAVPVLPLRMVAAGAGARTGISLFVLGEGRYTTGNFIEGTINPLELEYDWATATSNYVELRDEVFEEHGQQTFLVPFARRGALFRTLPNPESYVPMLYRTTGSTSGYQIMTDAIVQQAFANGETSNTGCADALRGLINDNRRVVDPCDDMGNCRNIDELSEIDVRTLACAPPIGSDFEFDDLAVALTGMHPKDVWLTRLDANLGRSAFGRDLELVPSTHQSQREGFIKALRSTNSSCAEARIAGGAAMVKSKNARLGIVITMLAIAGGAFGRRAFRLSRKKGKSK